MFFIKRSIWLWKDLGLQGLYLLGAGFGKVPLYGGLLSRLYGVVRIAEKDPRTSHMRACLGSLCFVYLLRTAPVLNPKP